jgi:hypothetical protein
LASGSEKARSFAAEKISYLATWATEVIWICFQRKNEDAPATGKPSDHDEANVTIDS